MSVRLRHVAAINPPTPEFESLPETAELPFLPLEAVWPGDRLDMTRRQPKAAVSSGYTRFRDGDILLPKITPTFQADRTVIASGLEGGLGAGTTELHVVRAGPDVDVRYLRYLLSSKKFLDEGEAAMVGVAGQKRVPDDCLRNLAVPVVDLRRQRAIADYLDRETARIDALIDKKGRMMGLLEERTRVLIDDMTHESQEGRVRHITSLCTSGPRGWADRVGGEGSPFIRSANLKRDSIALSYDDLARLIPPDSPEARRSEVETGDVLVGITGANTGWIGRVDDRFAGGYVSQHVAVLRPAGIEPDWLAYSLFSPRVQDQLLGGQYGGTKQQLGLDDLLELRIGLPQVEDQRSRVARMDAARQILEGLNDRLACQVEALRERRQALITAAVAGDLDVPGEAA